MAKTPKKKAPLQVEALTHTEAKRRNIPTAEHESVIEQATEAAKRVRYPRNTDLDPQLVWRGKDEQDAADFVVSAPPLYIQEKISGFRGKRLGPAGPDLALACLTSASSPYSLSSFTFAHRFFCAAEILARASALIVNLLGRSPGTPVAAPVS